MKHAWIVNGAYADWTMTVTATPLDGYTESDLGPPASDYKFIGLGKHFSDAVSLYEFLCERANR
jgi:hypothetical protein